jgi:hypothetical protein
MTLVAAYERLIRGRGQEIRPEIKPAPKEEVPTTASIPEKPAPAPEPSTESPPGPEMPANVAAKPTETPVESSSATPTESGTPHEEHVERETLDREPSSVTASVPAAIGPGGAGGLEHKGQGSEQ